MADETAESPLTMNDARSAPLGLFAAFVRQGFRVAVVYCLGGLALELLGPRLPAPGYGRVAGVFYGLPGEILRRTGAQAALAQGVMQGKLPTWLAAAAYPAVGVLIILLLASIFGAIAAFVRMLLSLRTR